MKILDRYIVNKFLAILFMASMAFVVLFVVVDLIENLDRFLNSQATLVQGFLYYLYYIPQIILLTLPVNMLLSSLFSLGSMSQYNELIACMSAGVSLYRLVLPIMILAFFISIGAGVFGETLVPEANRARLDIWRYEIRKEPRDQARNRSQLALQDYGNRQINISYYDGKRKMINKASIVEIRDNEVQQRWDVRKMIWEPDSSSWQMVGVIHRVLSDSGEQITEYDSLVYRNTRILPEDLQELQIQPEEMNYQELAAFVDNMRSIGVDARKWLADLHMKISYPFANFIIVLFGAPLASRKRRSGPAIGFALALLISFVYFLFMRSGQVLGHKGALDPMVGAWIGNVIFGTGGLLMMMLMRK